MDSDRKSTVSSFYGGRKGSMDALNNDFPSPTTNNYASQPNYKGRDDASSFFNPDRASRMDMNRGNGNSNSAGYNRNSFFFAGREEPLKGGRDEEEEHGGGFDIYADFNNAGPKYSSAYTSSNGYQALDPQSSPAPKPEDGTSTLGNVELVTVPALGPEWGKQEMKDMTKKAKRERKYESRRAAWKAWNRGERGICGKWFTRKILVIVLFVVCIVIGIILAFTVPRVPKFSFNVDHPLANATGSWADAVPVHFERLPANFTFPAFADLQIDTDSNYLPLHFNHLYATIFDSGTGKQVATGDLGSYTLPAKTSTDVLLPLNFTYTAVNFTDPTWKNWHDACQNTAVVQGGIRPGLNFRLLLEIHIAGLVGKREASTQVVNANCPIELPQNAG